jgi:hypothetical protein
MEANDGRTTKAKDNPLSCCRAAAIANIKYYRRAPRTAKWLCATVDRQLIGSRVAAGFACLNAIVRQFLEVATARVISMAIHPFSLRPPETWLPCLIRVGDRRGRRLSYPCHRPIGQASLVSSTAMTLIIHATTHLENPLPRRLLIAGARLSSRVNARNFSAHPSQPHAPRLFIMGADL